MEDKKVVIKVTRRENSKRFDKPDPTPVLKPYPTPVLRLSRPKAEVTKDTGVPEYKARVSPGKARNAGSQDRYEVTPDHDMKASAYPLYSVAYAGCFALVAEFTHLGADTAERPRIVGLLGHYESGRLPLGHAVPHLRSLA